MESVETVNVLRKTELLTENKNNLVKVFKRRREPVYFPRHIILNEDLLRALYLFWGDGSYTEKIHFTNKEPELHNFIVKMFEKYFDINKTVWRLRILYNEREGPAVEKIKSKWLENLGFEKTQLYPTIAITGFKSNINGNGRIIIDKLTYADFLRNFISHVNTLVENHVLTEKQLVSILDGILNAEGSALVDKDKIGLHKIVITVHEKELPFVRDILSQLNLNDIFAEQQGKL